MSRCNSTVFILACIEVVNRQTMAQDLALITSIPIDKVNGKTTPQYVGATVKLGVRFIYQYTLLGIV